eukprot:1138248-Pelagomonas_calceolata.AAC.1
MNNHYLMRAGGTAALPLSVLARLLLCALLPARRKGGSTAALPLAGLCKLAVGALRQHGNEPKASTWERSAQPGGNGPVTSEHARRGTQ